MLDTFPFDKRLAADLLADTETTATVLHMIILAAYGDEVYGSLEHNIEPADPVELWLRIKEDFSVNVPESNENKLNALMLALSTDAFYEDQEKEENSLSKAEEFFNFDGDILDLPEL
jgi:hypothetical protein